MYGYVRDVIVLFSLVRRPYHGSGNGGGGDPAGNRRAFYDTRNRLLSETRFLSKTTDQLFPNTNILEAGQNYQ